MSGLFGVINETQNSPDLFIIILIVSSSLILPTECLSVNFLENFILHNHNLIIMIDPRRIENFTQCIDYQYRHFPLSQRGSECSTVIIGERHKRIERCCQEKLIVMLKPEYVLIETFKDGDEYDAWFKSWKEKYCCKFDRCDIKVDDLTGEIDQDDIREKRMGEIILEDLEKSSEPLIAITGNWHARPESEIHEILKRHIDYICIWEPEALGQYY